VSGVALQLDPRIPRSVPVFVGEWHNRLAREVAAVARHQWQNMISDGIRGYIFHGSPGTGKTWTAFKVAELLGLLDLHRKGLEAVIYRDCADLASWRYGETEKEIRNVFRRAYERADDIKRRQRDAGVLLIFDDAEGLFLTRSYGSKLDTWYIAQLNVFFHEVDAMDTSKLFIILTTNRIDLLDEALKDRFIDVEFQTPSEDVLVRYAEERLRALGIYEDEVVEVARRQVKNGAKTFRDVNKITTRIYLEYLAKKYKFG
jgi:SpoVK/Ycf46/Vps4 family AAA+-type ATPase